MMRKIVSLLVILAMVISFAQTTYALPEDELILKLKNATNDTIVKTFCEDFNGDGFNEMFAFTGTKIDGEIYPDTVSGSLWFVSNDSISKIEEDHGIGFVLSGDMAPTFLHIGNTIQFQYQTMLGNWDTHSTVCSVNNDSVISSYFSGYLMKRDNQYVVNQTSYDGWVNKADFHKGAYFGVGRTWKDYWYYFDESTLTFKEYGAVEITKEQFEEFNGATEILSNINGTVHNILYRGNGIININILKDAGEEYELLNVLIGYDSSKVWIIDNKQDYISVEGHYLPALNYYMAVYPEFKSPQIKVVLNGEEVEFDQPPVMINDRVMVPIRAIFEAMGATVNWNEHTQTVTSTKHSTVITLKVGDYNIIKNGVESYFDVATQIVNNRTLVPVRAVAESLGAEVVWDGDTQTVFIDTSAKINAIIINADEDITGNDAALVRSVLLNNKLAKVNENNFHSRFEPSEESFNKIVDATILQAGESDITYFYYSGHGGADGHISPTYNNETHDNSFTLTPQEIIDTLERVPGTIVVVLDSCYSGAINNLTEVDKNKFKILTASESNSYSNADNLTLISTEQIGNFTEAFLNALGGLEGTNIIYNTITGRDGKVKADYNNDYNVTLSELFMYIDENMEKKYKDDQGNVCYQNPTCSDIDDETVIYKY